jgi:ABC-type sugar transport system ATPase subunit
MPNISLQNIIVRFDGLPSKGDGLLSKIARGSARVVGNRDLDYLHENRVNPEPPNRLNAIDNLSLNIRNGETLSLLGPSGCGKSTLLRAISGLIKTTSGEVLYDSVPIHNISMDERGIGMVFQNFALYPHLRTVDNIGFYDIIHKQPERIPERIRHIVEVMGVDISHLLSRKPPTLSGGEKQRVAVARCLARDPKLFLFDEPLSNLDAKLRTQTRVEIKRLLRHYKITSIYVTHDQTEAISLGDRIAIMQEGKIAQIGTYKTLYETPLNAFVAGFLGTPPMNLFKGYIQGDMWLGKGFKISAIRGDLKSGQEVLLGIRPEHLKVVDDGLPAQVEYIEQIYTDQIQLVYLKIGSQSCVAKISLDNEINIGTTIHLGFPAENIYLFDQKSGIRIG